VVTARTVTSFGESAYGPGSGRFGVAGCEAPEVCSVPGELKVGVERRGEPEPDAWRLGVGYFFGAVEEPGGDIWLDGEGAG
jgi:hypothetical protein